MKHLTTKSTSIFSAFIFSALLVLSGCTEDNREVETTKKDDVAQAQNDLEKARIAYRAEVDQFKLEYNQRIAANEREIERVKANIKDSKKEVKAEYKDQLDMFEKRNAELKRELAEFNDDDMNKWQTFKAEFSKDVNELGEAFGNFTTSDNN